jgi:short-subunit dehydrogenase
VTLAHAFLQQAESGDALINLSSITNFLPTPLQPTYCATKAFIVSLSESLWYQQRPRGVYVQGLCPGIAKTKFVERAGELGDEKRLLDALSQTPESVVDVSLAALDKRAQPIVVPGLGNLVIAGATRLLPRRPLIWLSGKLDDLAGLD